MFVKDMLRGDENNEIKVKVIKVIEEKLTDYDD